MSNWSRRHIFRSAAALPALPLILADNEATGAPNESNARSAATNTPKPLIHVTDLFRPHNDPDDHWDLATGYALTCRGDVELRGILIDNPGNLEEMPELLKALDGYAAGGVHTGVHANPDIAAAAQLNYITDRAVPVTTGSIWPGKPGEKVRGDNLPKELRGVNMLLDILKRSAQPVAILTGGSCQDVAIAGKKEPRLFSEKCAGIYLNAGVGSQNPKEQLIEDNGGVEWNVSLNPGAYATIFELPCPIYWMPAVNSKSSFIGEYGTVWSFRQKEILPHLSDRLQAFFAYVLSKESGTNWLSYLLDPNSKTVAQKYLDEVRGMWCTAGFLHAAGKTVTVDGQIVSLDAPHEKALYEFVPADIRCNADGITNWRKASEPTHQWIFRVRDTEKYPQAMVRALKSILLTLT